MHGYSRGTATKLAAAAAVALLVTGACSSKSTPKASTGAAAGGSASTAASAGSAASGAAVIMTTKGSLGTFLTDSSGRTLYLFMADTSTSSTCYQACATYWPPVLTKGTPTGGGGVDASKLGTTPRKDGTTQVTYGGHPLYRFLPDKKQGDTKGQGSNGFNAKWWVVGTDGNPITSTSGSSSSSGGSSGGGNY